MSNRAAQTISPFQPVVQKNRTAQLGYSGSPTKALITAVLLTGSAAIAEAIVLKVIEARPDPATDSEALLCQTVNASLRMPGEIRLIALTDAEAAGHTLPPELQAVFVLPRLLRQCYVLNILLSLPRRECAFLLKLSEIEVSAHVGEAALALASASACACA